MAYQAKLVNDDAVCVIIMNVVAKIILWFNNEIKLWQKFDKTCNSVCNYSTISDSSYS